MAKMNYMINNFNNNKKTISVISESAVSNWFDGLKKVEESINLDHSSLSDDAQCMIIN